MNEKTPTTSDSEDRSDLSSTVVQALGPMSTSRRGTNLLRRVPTHLAVASEIKKGLASGEFARGAQLPTERELSERHGVSRTVVREAMKLLQAQSLVSVRHGYGTFVSENAHEALAGPMETLLGFGDISFDEIMSVRQIIEPPLARHAAQARSSADVEALANIVEAMLAAETPFAHEILDAEFHNYIVDVYGNRLAIELVKSIRVLLQGQIRELFDRPDWVSSADEYHQRILEAVRKRQPRRAEDMMREHLQRSHEFMLKLVGDSPRGGAPLSSSRANR